MADPTNRADPAFANNPNYVWSGGRWQNANNGSGVDPNAPAAGGHVQGSTAPWDPIPSGATVLQRAGGGNVNDFAGYQQMEPMLEQRATRTTATNPYSSLAANQARPAQQALLSQMQAQQAGPSVANMMGARAQGQNLQAALGAGNRGAMMQAGQIGAGLAGQTGMGRLGEQMGMSAGQGSLINGVRGQDLGVAGQSSQYGLQAQSASDEQSRLYAQLAAQLNEARTRAALENFKLGKRIDTGVRDTALNASSQAAGAGATALSAATQGK